MTDDALGFADELVDGTVVDLRPQACPGGEDEGVNCATVVVRVAEGPDRGDLVDIDYVDAGGAPPLEVDDRLVLGRGQASSPAETSYYVVDFQRRTPLIWLAIAFAVAVVALGRWRGVRALVALAISLVVIVEFVLPAILEGRSPVAVALVGSALILVVALYFSHGLNARTTTAVLGTVVSLLLTGFLASLFVGATQLTGLGSEEASILRAFATEVDLRGLLLAGIIIGSLGVLDDVTVTQASAVWELHHANPEMGTRRLYQSALRIGRDHIASTVNTLVLAYAGAALPLLVLFTYAQRPLTDVAMGEVVAVEIVRTLVGSIGLVASVPVTTALASVVVSPPQRGELRPRRRRLPRDEFRHPEEQAWRDAADG